MAEETNIEWCRHTFNGWIGCTRVSEGCRNCYAEAMMDKRWGKVKWGPGQPRKRTAPANWRKPLAWNRKAEAAGKQALVFCSSLADVFDDEVPLKWRSDLWDLIEETPWLTWLLLTKRPENVAAMGTPFTVTNWWLGTTAENQAMYMKRLPYLAQIPAPKHFLSCEPLLSGLDLGLAGTRPKDWNSGYGPVAECIDWVICGGESGPAARTMKVEWARNLRDQCLTAGIPFFMKQMTKKAPIPEDLFIREFPHGG